MVPIASGLVVRSVAVDGPAVVLDAEGAMPAARCPACRTVSSRVHQARIADELVLLDPRGCVRGGVLQPKAREPAEEPGPRVAQAQVEPEVQPALPQLGPERALLLRPVRRRRRVRGGVVRRIGQRPLHRHEARHAHDPASEPAVLALHPHQGVGTGVAERDEDEAVVCELLGPARGHVRAADGRDDPVERRRLRRAREPVPAESAHVRVAHPRQAAAGVLDHVLLRTP